MQPSAAPLLLGGVDLLAGGGVPAVPALLLLVAAVALSAWSYRSVVRVRDHGRAAPWAVTGLRLLAVFLLALLVLGPVLRLDRTPRDSRRIAVLVDNSRSMGIADSIGGRARIDAALHLLTSDETALLERLGEIAQTGLYSFGADIRRAEPGKWGKRAEEDASDLAKVLRSAEETSGSAPLEAVVILTDGCETGTASVTERRPAVPVFPVGVGSLEEAMRGWPDVAVAKVHVDRETLVASTVPVRVELSARGLEGERVDVELRCGGRAVAGGGVVIEGGTAALDLTFSPREAGLFEYEVRAVPVSSERIRENNSRFFAVKAAATKIRVLYYEGTPRWECRFLARELKKDAHIALQSMLRTNADRLYRTGTEGGAGFSIDALNGIDCLILGDLHAEDLTAEHAGAIVDFVSEKGGGLIVLAGRESLGGTLASAGLDALLPLQPGLSGVLEGAFDVQVTREGVTHPVLFGVRRFPPVEGLFQTGPPKPGAMILAQAVSGERTYPLVAAHRYGSGRVLQSASDGTWRWVMKHAGGGGAETFARLWGQAVRWAADRVAGPAEEGTSVEIRTDKDIYLSGDVVRFHVLGTDLEGIRSLKVGEKEVTLSPGPSGLEGAFVPGEPGLKKASIGDASHAFFVERPAGEFDRVALQEELLRRLARESGGQYFDVTKARLVPEALSMTERLRVERAEIVLRHSWAVFAVILLALAGEWVLRKQMQMM